jgi:hypothetical protein
LGIKSKHKKGNDLSAAPGSNVHRRKGKDLTKFTRQNKESVGTRFIEPHDKGNNPKSFECMPK